MLLRGFQRARPPAVTFVGEGCGMDFAAALESHKVAVMVIEPPVNPADARRA
jgi:hypothetical protein